MVHRGLWYAGSEGSEGTAGGAGVKARLTRHAPPLLRNAGIGTERIPVAVEPMGSPWHHRLAGRPLRWQRAAAHSITSSARASTDGGMVRPRALAAFRLTRNSNLVGW